MVGGYEGSVMESRIGEAFSVLLWANGDGVLAPLVLAMAEVKRLQRVGGGAWGTMLHNNVLWTSLGEGSLILVEFCT